MPRRVSLVRPAPPTAACRSASPSPSASPSASPPSPPSSSRARQPRRPKKGTTLAKTPQAGPGRPCNVLGLPVQDDRVARGRQHVDAAPRRDPRRLVHRAQRRADLVQLHRPLRRRDARPDVHLPDRRPLRLHRLRDRGLAPPQRLARSAGRELPGTRLRPAGRRRHRVGHRLVEPDRAEQHAPGAGREVHPHGREQQFSFPLRVASS